MEAAFTNIHFENSIIDFAINIIIMWCFMVSVMAWLVGLTWMSLMAGGGYANCLEIALVVSDSFKLSSYSFLKGIFVL